MKPMLDVLVTFYNQEKYVDRALESVFSQKCGFDFRVLIGDDGSTDNTLKEVDKWNKKYPGRISVYQMDRDPGVKYIGGFRASRNRLNLLKNVISPYFIFLDGDDYFTDSQKLQKQVDILEDEKNSDCIACSHAIEALYDDGTKKIFPWQQPNEGKFSLENYWADFYFHTDTSLIRSSVIEKIPFELIENHYNDNMITYLAMQNGMIYYLPEVMACYPQTGDGIWTSGNIISNNLRNMMLYDLCVTINPALEEKTAIRFQNAWKNLYKHRKEIDRSKLSDFDREATQKKLLYSSQWIHYNELDADKKRELEKNAVRIARKGFAFKVKKKLFKK